MKLKRLADLQGRKPWNRITLIFKDGHTCTITLSKQFYFGVYKFIKCTIYKIGCFSISVDKLQFLCNKK